MGTSSTRDTGMNTSFRTYMYEVYLEKRARATSSKQTFRVHGYRSVSARTQNVSPRLQTAVKVRTLAPQNGENLCLGGIRFPRLENRLEQRSMIPEIKERADSGGG